MGAETPHRLSLAGDARAGYVVQAVGLYEREGHISIKESVLSEIDHLLPALTEEFLYLITAIGEGGGLSRINRWWRDRRYSVFSVGLIAFRFGRMPQMTFSGPQICYGFSIFFIDRQHIPRQIYNFLPIVRRLGRVDTVQQTLNASLKRPSPRCSIRRTGLTGDR